VDNLVAIAGIGLTPLRPVSPDLSFRELVFEAATRAYADAGVDPRDVDGVVTVAEDLHEGTSITDEYTPDQLGAVLKPVQTVAGDGLQGLAAACLLIRSGAADVVVVEAHSKASNVLEHEEVLAIALDPLYERPWGLDPHAVAALEMRRYLHEAGVPERAVAEVVVANRRRALRNPFAAYGADLTVEQVLTDTMVADPLRAAMMSQTADGAVVLVLAAPETARALRGRPVMVRGIGWASDEPSLSGRPWAEATYAHLAAAMAYRDAGLRAPGGQVDLFEVDDTYAHKQLQHLEAALGLPPGGALREGAALAAADRVNASGGHLGMGYGYDASALMRVAVTALQVRGEAGPMQLPGVRTAVVLSWRGVPTTTGGAVVLSAA